MNTLLTNPNEIARLAMETPVQKKVNLVAEKLRQWPQADCPLAHEFVRHLYIRTIFVPHGTLVVSKIFKTDFPFFVAQGSVSVWTEHEGAQNFEAPHWGLTKAGSRRIIMHHTDVVWITVHNNPNDLRNIEQLESEILYTP